MRNWEKWKECTSSEPTLYKFLVGRRKKLKMFQVTVWGLEVKAGMDEVDILLNPPDMEKEEDT